MLPFVVGCFAARSRALDWPCFNRAISDTKKPLGRGARNREISEIEVAGERCRIALPQSRVKPKRMFGERSEQSLRDVDLETVAGVNVLDGSTNRREICVAIEVAANTSIIAKRKLRCNFIIAYWPLHVSGSKRNAGSTAKNFRHSSRRPLAPPAWIHLRVSGRDQPRSIDRMIPGNRPIVDADGQVGCMKLVESRARHARWHVAARSRTSPRSRPGTGEGRQRLAC